MTGSKPKAPGVKDVAAAAGVSVATVSRVIAKTGYPVAQATRERVLAAAHQLGFVPNALARGLARSRSDSIGVIAPSLANPYYATMIESIDRAAENAGLSVLLGLTRGDENRREAIIDGLLGRQVDGLIIIAGADDHLAGRSPDILGIPAVLIGTQPNSGFPIITIDNVKAGRDAAAHLWALGHRHFCYLTGLDTWHDFRDRGQGITDFLASTDGHYELMMLAGLLEEADSYRRVLEIWASGLRTTAFIASTDRHALGAIAALVDAGARVPQEVSVVGFDDYVTSQFVRPALTTVHMPAAKMAELAVGHLLQLLAGDVLLSPEPLRARLIERGSTGAFPHP